MKADSKGKKNVLDVFAMLFVTENLSIYAARRLVRPTARAVSMKWGNTTFGVARVSIICVGMRAYTSHTFAHIHFRVRVYNSL